MSKTRELGHYRLLARDGVYVEVNAILLGEGSSYAEGKNRWFEVTIYADDDGEYVVHTVGRTELPDERDLGRVERTSSPYDVIELLTVRRTSARHGHGDRRASAPYIPRASARALAQAAEFDDGLHDAYLRVVA